MSELPPNPSLYRNPQEWQLKLYEYLLTQTRVGEVNNPLPVLLPFKTGDERAAQDGVMMYDPVAARVVVAKGGVWVALAEV